LRGALVVFGCSKLETELSKWVLNLVGMKSLGFRFSDKGRAFLVKFSVGIK